MHIIFLYVKYLISIHSEIRKQFHHSIVDDRRRHPHDLHANIVSKHTEITPQKSSLREMTPLLFFSYSITIQ